jgi:hypothetical protein
VNIVCSKLSFSRKILIYIDAVCGHLGCSKRISEEDDSFRFSKGNTKLWLCSERKFHVPDILKLGTNVNQIVARQMAATNINATQTPNTVKITPRRTNARFRTALRIEVRNTTAANTLASIPTAFTRHWPRVGVKTNAVTIRRAPRQGVLDMWTWIPTTIRRSFAPTIVNAR